MSLIEEALRKQKEEVERIGKISPTPPPLPETSSPVQEPKEAVESTRPWGLLAGLFLGGILLILLILWLLFYGMHLWRTSPEIPAQGLKSVAVLPTNSPAANTSRVETASIPTNSPSSTGPSVSSQSIQGVITVTTPPSPTNQPPSLTAPVTSTEKPPLPTQWPRLLISGVIGGGKTGHSAVIINGRLLSPGESIDSVKVVAIDRQRVKLVYEGEERVLSAGSTTE